MLCLTCHELTKGRLCHECMATMYPAPDRLLPGGIRVVAPFEHEGAPRRLMHLLKYQGITDFAGLVADLLASRLPEAPITPVPRAWSRRLKYGVDPALEIARELSARTGQPVIRALAAPLHSRRRAGGDHGRSPPAFRLRHPPPGPVIVLDDVVTTGGTLLSAVGTLGLERVAICAAANAAPKVSSLSADNQ